VRPTRSRSSYRAISLEKSDVERLKVKAANARAGEEIAAGARRKTPAALTRRDSKKSCGVNSSKPVQY
jgi:hypothetical protein